MRVVESRADFVSARAELPGAQPGGDPGTDLGLGPGARLGLVPTMGALHAGHAALLRQARAQCTWVIATVFVNPMQFGPTEDLARYPRTLDADLAECARHGVDLVWVPSVADVYPGGEVVVSVAPGPLGSQLEGLFRPTHFAGVLTVVAKLFAVVRPDVAYFGEKDYQQLTLIRRMALDLDFGLQVVGVPTVREEDGLALSSRNRYLTASERADALALSRALRAGAQAAADGDDPVAAGCAVLNAVPAVEVDYFELRGVDLGPAPERGTARLLVAARVGSTRLIDNVAVQLGEPVEPPAVTGATGA